MSWSDFYLFCFGFGFFFSLVAMVTGHLNLNWGAPADGSDPGALSFDHGDPGAHADVSGHDASSHHVSPLNFGTGAAFLAWFGGTGYLVNRFYGLWFVTTLLVAGAAGVAGGYSVFWFLSRVLMREQEEMDPADYEMVGVLGQVSSAIRAGGIGEVLYTQQGFRRGVAARSDDGSAIASGTEVVVTRYEDGIAYVRRWDDLASGAGAAS